MPPPGETGAVAGDKERKTKYVKVDDIVQRIKTVTNRIVLLDSIQLATKVGNPRAENSVLVGAACACHDFPISAEAVRKAVLALVPKKTVEANSKAFDLGKESGGSCLGT